MAGDNSPFLKDITKYPKHPFAKNAKNVAPKLKPKSNTVTPPPPKPMDAEFLKSLRDTGKLNWKKAPKEIKTRYYGMYAVLFSIPIIIISSYEMYRRLEGKSTKKVQQGEILEDRTIRKFDEAEKWKVEKESIMYRIFGRDFFLDGFTSRTMKESKSANEKDEK